MCARCEIKTRLLYYEFVLRWRHIISNKFAIYIIDRKYEKWKI